MARTQVLSYGFDPRARTVTLTGVASPTKYGLSSIANGRTRETYYLRNDIGRITLSGKTITLPVGVITVAARPDDPLIIWYDPEITDPDDGGGTPGGPVGVDDVVGLPAVLQGKADVDTVTAALTTKIAKGELVANVKDYGAVGDGTVNDTTAIQAAITAVGNAGGGSVFLPRGTYKLTATIKMRSGVELYGVGPLSVLKPVFPTTNPNRVIDNDWVNGNKDITLRSFKLDRSEANLSHGMLFNGIENLLLDGIEVSGQSVNNSGAVCVSGILNTGVIDLESKNVRVVNCYFADFHNFGFQIGFVDGCVIANNVFANASREAIGIEPEVGSIARNVSVSGNTLHGADAVVGTTTGLIIVTETSGGTILSCSVTGNAVSQLTGGDTSNPGITVSGGDGISVTGNTIRGMDGPGIKLGITGYNVTNGAVVSGNTVIDCGHSTFPGILLRNATRCVIVGNYVYGASHVASVSEEAETTDNFITMNYLRDAVPVTTPSVGTVVFGNKITDADTAVRVGANTMGNPRLAINGNGTGGVRRLSFQTAGVDRWCVDVSGTEAGSNSGSDMAITGRADADGTSLGATVSFKRSARRVTLGGSLAMFRRAVSANYTVVSNDHLLAVTDTSAARTITLPVVATDDAGRELIIKDESGGAGTNNITIQRGGTNTIDGATSVAINVNYGVMRLYCTGTGWSVADKTIAAVQPAGLLYPQGTTKSANYTLALADAHTIVPIDTVAEDLTVYVPLNATAAIPVGTVIGLWNRASNQIFVAGEGGVIIRTATSLKSRAAAFAMVWLLKTGTDEWVFYGDTDPTP